VKEFLRHFWRELHNRYSMLLPPWLDILIFGYWFMRDDEKCPVCGKGFTWLDQHTYGRILWGGAKNKLTHSTCYQNQQDNKESDNVYP